MTDQRGGGASHRVLTVPNLLSFLRLCLIPVFLWAFLTTRDSLAFALLVVVGGSDWVDGFVARRTGQVSELGKLLDPAADRVAIVAVLLALAFRGTIRWELAGAIVGRDLIVAVVFAVLEARGGPRIPVNRVGKAATATIFTGLALAAGSLVLREVGEPSFAMRADAAQGTSSVLLAAGAVLYWMAGALYVVEIRRRLPAARGG